MTTITIADNAAIQLRYANRHGLITGATGGGKTVTLQKLAEGFSAAGVPVFAADIKGDLSGVYNHGDGPSFPTRLWDLFGQDGIHLRTTLHDMGPMILARMLGLNDTQEGVLTIAFRYAEAQNYLLMTMDDLRAMLNDCLDNIEYVRLTWGNVTAASIGAIQRGMLMIEGQGGNAFFGEPAIDLQDFIAHAQDGRGMINLLSADRLMGNPRLYAAFLLWFLTRLFEQLPEVGDLDKPKLVFFFDEAHILFSEAPKALLEAVERTVKLIRSRGVGVYFVSQNPCDIPDTVLAQLGTRIQHALRAFTPREQKAIKAAAETFRPNPKLNIGQEIQTLGVGEAIFSTLGDGGVPTIAEKVKVTKPQAQIGPITYHERRAAIEADPIRSKYSNVPGLQEQYIMLLERCRPEWLRQNEAERLAEDQSRKSKRGFLVQLFGLAS